MRHDKEMNYNCKKCDAKISAHNKDWHDNLCDKCFNGEYYSDETEIFSTDLKEIEKMYKSDSSSNIEFKDFLKSGKLDNKRFLKIVREVEEKIDCTECGNCCKVLKIPVNEEDIKRISNSLKISSEEFITKYVEENSKGKKFLHKPCNFLENNKCTIYEVRPEECKKYPNLDKDITIRTIGFLSNAEMCPIVFNVLENSKDEFCEDIYEDKMERGEKQDKNG